MSRSSRGLGYRPFTAITPVRIRYGTPYKNTLDMQIAYRDIRNVSVFLYGRLAQLVETTDDTKKIQNEILILENLRPVSLMVELRLYTAVTAVRFS